MKYKIVNHRTDDDAPAWHWYLYDDAGGYICHSDKRHGTRRGAVGNMYAVCGHIALGQSLDNWYGKPADDPGLKDAHYLEERKEQKWLKEYPLEEDT